ncbi:S-layer homology domain-containing protein [Paenibacillus sp. UNCCL117]|uniref:S-layer homology domain-containing protein n=1 Tax=unclassified Paenibacillus TaxID=185978 RepID=UPI0008825961|nr:MULTISPECIES: S-layer homology domain-containing protein [unclassified Paenibacillus]SDD72112.1 S-layer homology domain-containing protein [Paenibacillus sp. cl123]SFW45664.1 S-layer homology domain-containing protein [Paenibacillus sp. UNCCL117]
MNPIFKKTLVSGLTLAMVLGGTSAALADGKDKGRDDKRGNDHRSEQARNWGDSKPGQKNNKLKLSFDDLKGSDVEWAARYIASLASKQVFEGYEDGTFQPRKTITRIEAITAAVRLMGLRDQAESDAAKQANLNFSDANKIKEKYGWAVGYVSVALQNDLFTETDAAVQPDKEADRLWATTLLVKALKLQDEAKSKMNAKLPFKDAGKIPAGSVGYVAVALERGLIDGYEDNTFRPNQQVTRAELAALLDRTGSQLPDNTAYKGTVTGPVTTNMLSVKASNNETISVEMDGSAYVFRNGVRVAPSQLVAGDQVLVRTYGGKIIFVEVTKMAGDNGQSVDFVVTGTLNGYTLNSQGSLATISINQNVSGGGVQTAVYNVAQNVYISGDVSLLTAGRSIELRGKQQSVHTVIIR